jgi:quinol monooxygenase YgiN
MKLDVIAHIYATEGEEALVKEVLTSYVAPTRLEEGCLRYDLFADLNDPCRFTFVEEWTSAEALQAHSQSAHIAAGRARLANGKLREPGWVQRLTQIA